MPTLLSVVIPMYNEAEVLETLFGRLLPVLESITPDWEVVCVDDGSKDGTYAALKAWNLKEARVKALTLSRNFGKEKALTAAIDHAAGQAVIPIDADLQDPPELIPEMVAKWREGFPVVLATRRSRPGDSWLKKESAHLFYKLISAIGTVQIPEDTGDFRLMDRQVIEVIKSLPERTRFMKGLFAWAGFPQAVIHYDRPGRAQGTTSWNYWKLWQFALDGIFSFTTLPLRIWTYLGLFISLFSFLFAAGIILRTLIFGADVPGYPSLMVVILFIGGIQLMSLGVLGEYIGRIYRETKQRPNYVVRETVGIENRG